MNEAVNVFIRNRQILQIEKWVLRAILAEAFLIALWPAGATVALALGIVFWIRRLQLDPEFHFRHLPFDVPVALFVIISAMSILVSPDPAFSFYNYYNLVGVYGLTYLLVGQNIRNRWEIRKVMGAFGASALLVVLYGFYQYLFGIDIGEMRWVDGEAFPELRTRVFSTWENPNILAGYLDAAICVSLGIFAKTDGRTHRIALAVGMVLMALCLVMTYARGALLTMALILAVYGILRDRRILLACLAGGILLLLADSALYERLTSVYTKMDTSSEMRLAIWESTIAMIEDHPFFGIGWGAYWMVYPSYDFYLQGADVKLVHAHNVYLNYAAEIGIVGALAFFWYFFGTLEMAFSFRDEKLAEDRKLAEVRKQKLWMLRGRIQDLMHLIAVKRNEEALQAANAAESAEKETPGEEKAETDAEREPEQVTDSEKDSKAAETESAAEAREEKGAEAEKSAAEDREEKEAEAEESAAEADETAPEEQDSEDDGAVEEKEDPAQETAEKESSVKTGKTGDEEKNIKEEELQEEAKEAEEAPEAEGNDMAEVQPGMDEEEAGEKAGEEETPGKEKEEQPDTHAVRHLAAIAVLEQQLKTEQKELEKLEAEERPAQPEVPLQFEKELMKWEPYTLCEGVSLGIGMALISVALNGMTDDLLFNIPTSMLLWFLAALAAGIQQLPREDKPEERRIFHEVTDHDIQGDH